MTKVEIILKKAKRVINAPCPKKLETIVTQMEYIKIFIRDLNTMDVHSDDLDEVIGKLEDRLEELSSLRENQNQVGEQQSGKKFSSIPLDGEKLTGSNWAIWKAKTNSRLKYYECANAIVEKLDDDSEENTRAHMIILNSIEKNVLGLIEIPNNAYDLWKVVANKYESHHSGHLTELFQKLCHQTLEDYSQIDAHLDTMKSYFNEINGIKKILAATPFLHIVLQSLCLPFNTPQTLIANNDPLEDIDYVFRSLSAEAKSKVTQMANYTNNGSRKTFEKKSIIRCKLCKKKGHLVQDCFKVKKAITQKNEETFPRRANFSVFHSTLLSIMMVTGY